MRKKNVQNHFFYKYETTKNFSNNCPYSSHLSISEMKSISFVNPVRKIVANYNDEIKFGVNLAEF